MTNKCYLAISILVVVFSMASPTVASTASPYTVDFDLHNMDGFDDNKISAEDIVAFIQEKYPDSPMLIEATIGSCFISAGQTNNVNPAFLVATACLEGGFGTLGWTQSHPECHNTFGYGIPSGATQPDDLNCMDSWCAMVHRVASSIARGNNYYTLGLNTVGQVRAKYAASPNAESIANLMNELFTFSEKRKSAGTNAAAAGASNKETRQGSQEATQSTASESQGATNPSIAPQIAWVKTFGGAGSDVGSSVQQTNDGGYIIVGTSSSNESNKNDAWLIKTESNGNKLWDKTFGGSEYDAGTSVQETNDGGYIIAGDTNTYGKTGADSDVWLIKTDSNGNKLWDKTFGERENDRANSVQQTNDGGYIIAGTKSFSDFWLINSTFQVFIVI